MIAYLTIGGVLVLLVDACEYRSIRRALRGRGRR